MHEPTESAWSFLTSHYSVHDDGRSQALASTYKELDRLTGSATLSSVTWACSVLVTHYATAESPADKARAATLSEARTLLDDLCDQYAQWSHYSGDRSDAVSAWRQIVHLMDRKVRLDPSDARAAAMLARWSAELDLLRAAL